MTTGRPEPAPMPVVVGASSNTIDFVRLAPFESLRTPVVQRWQELHASWDLAWQVPIAIEQFEALFEGIVLGRLSPALLGDMSYQASVHGLPSVLFVTLFGSLLDAFLEVATPAAHSIEDLAAVSHVLADLRLAAGSMIAISYPDEVAVSPAAGASKAAGGDMPVHLLRRILSLSSSVGPESSLDTFSQRLAHIVCDISASSFAVIYLFDTADGAFYAEGCYGLGPSDWQEVLAVGIPRHVYERVTIAEREVDHVFTLHHDDQLLLDPDIAACFEPLGHSGQIPEGADRVESRRNRARRSLLLLPLVAPGHGVIGFCAAAERKDGRRLGATTRRALQALATQGAIFIENINLYRLQREEAAVSAALLQVAGVARITDVDLLVQQSLSVLPSLFGAQFAALLYLDHKGRKIRMLEPKGPDGGLTALTEARVAAAKLEQLVPILHGKDPVAIDTPEVGLLFPAQLVETRSICSVLLIPLTLTTRPADALAVFWTTAPHRFRPRDMDVARGVSELVGVALANAQLFDDATNRAEQLTSLYRTGQMMSSSLDLDAALRTITAAAVQLTRSRLCVIYLIDPKTGFLEYVADTGLEGQEPAHTPLRPGEGLFGRCALLGKPLVIDDLHAEGRHATAEPVLAAGVRSALLLPLIASGEVIGVLGTAAETPSFFLSEHQQLLQAFANQAAVAIERARLYLAEQRRRELAELQQAITQALGSTLELRDVLGHVLRFAGLLAPYDMAGVHIFNLGAIDLAVWQEASGAVTESPYHSQYVLSEPLYAQMRASGSAVVVTDTTREPLWRAPSVLPDAGSWIGAPLLSDGEYVVVLDLYSRRTGVYSQEEADSIGHFAHQVAFAVRNARIYAREREAKMRLEELDQLRADFVSTVSHELRTPLTGIKGFTETLLTYWPRLDDERKHHYLDRIYGASKRLERLVQDLLFASKVEGGNLPLAVRRVQLEDLIEPAVMEIKQKYRGQVVITEIPEQLPPVLADADRAQQVLVNLMDNAVKYSPEGSEIIVRCLILPDIVQLLVIDHGPGIRPQDMPRLFTRFGKIDQVIRAGHVGTGLGLYISKQLVEQMNGVISVESVVSRGSTFSFTLPQAANSSSN